MRYANVFWFDNINSMGGVETYLYEMARKYGYLDITVLYRTANLVQLRRLKKLVRCVKYEGQCVVCDKIFFNYNKEIINMVEAKEYIEVIHANYLTQDISLNINPKINRYIGVSEIVCEAFEKRTGIKCELLYSPITMDKPKRVLRLISATRLSKEKGLERMKILAEELDKHDIPYSWTIFTDKSKYWNNPNICYMKPKLDIRNYIADSDYVVQLSSSEGYGYTVLESLMVGTPVIVTPCPSFKEMGVINGVNGYVLNFDMTDIPVKDIYENILKFEYKEKISDWSKVLINKKSTYKEELKMKYEVEALETYERYNVTDVELGRVPKAGERFTVTKERLDVLLGENSKGRVYVKVVEEEVTEEVVQAVANAIVEEAEETNKTVDTVVEEIVEESKPKKRTTRKK